MKTNDVKTDVKTNEIKVKAAQLISEQLKLDQVDWNQNLTQLGMDSLDLIELVFKLEDAFKKPIHDEVVLQWQTLDDIVSAFN